MTEDRRVNSAIHLAVPGFEFLELIGKGGMGEVYLARQLTLNRLVAIKVLSLDQGADRPNQIERFRREAELMARAAHPNIVSIFDFGVVDGRPYLVMERIEGGDLRMRLTRQKPLRVEHVAEIVRPVGRALTYLHRLGILHRDLKPENVLLLNEDNPKVTDFGIAVLHAETGGRSTTSAASGTIGYVAPEQHYGLAVDHRADEYSLAAMTYEMLTGHMPLGVIRPPSSHNRRLGSAVDRVLLKALEEDRDDRYATIAEFSDALDEAFAALRESSRRPRGRWIAAAGLTLACSIAILTAVVAAGATRDRSLKPAAVGSTAERIGAKKDKAVDSKPDKERFQTNSIGMELALIPAGEFEMGAIETDSAAEENEFPRHRVRLTKPFWIGRTEVTVGQFKAFVDQTSYKTYAEASGRGGCIWNLEQGKVVESPTIDWRNDGSLSSGGNAMPVSQVTWHDAIKFCEWLGAEEHAVYRLPTEAEWEYACRAGSASRWSSGEDPKDLDRHAWTVRNAGYMKHPVGSLKPNVFGLYDMHGNVWEWCLDWYGPYADGSQIDPTGPKSGTDRVVRGGAYDWLLEKTRSSVRTSSHALHRYVVHGFRVVREVDSTKTTSSGAEREKDTLKY